MRRRFPGRAAEGRVLCRGTAPLARDRGGHRAVRARGRRSGRRTETRQELLSRLLDPTLTLDETARMLDVCPTTVRRYTNRGILAHERSRGNQRRFKLSCVLAFMEGQARAGLVSAALSDNAGKPE